jgi:hypothetical protein
MGKGEMAKIGGEMAKGELGEGEMGINRKPNHKTMCYSMDQNIEAGLCSNDGGGGGVHRYGTLETDC